MKASDVRKLIGKRVRARRLGWHMQRTCTVLDVKGKNVCIDDHGSTDWLWIPDYSFTVLPEEPDHGN